MANSMIADLLKTPRQVREEEQAQLQAKGLAAQKAILAQGTPSTSLFGGAMQGLASQYASYVPESVDIAKRNLMQLGGMDPRSAREVEAVEGRNIARVAMSGDLAKMKEMREALMRNPNVDPRALAVLTERIAAEEKRQAPKIEELSSEAYKEVMKATANQRTAEANVTKANGLLSRYQKIKPLGLGGASSAWETIKRAFGGQDATSSLKADFDALVNSAVIENLPPGPATDKDIELIQKGFPNSSWSRQEIEGWLEAYRDAAEFQAWYEDQRATYMTANRGLDVGFPRAIREKAKKFRDAQVARRTAASESTGAKEQKEDKTEPQTSPDGLTTSPGSNVNAVQTQPGASPGTMTAPAPVDFSSLQRGRSFPTQRTIEQSGTENLGEF